MAIGVLEKDGATKSEEVKGGLNTSSRLDKDASSTKLDPCIVIKFPHVTD